jgi:hypothetical protein
MNWDAIGAIAELLGAVGVIASLVYLATQIRQSRDQMSQNTKAMKAGAYQQASDGLSHTINIAVSTPGFPRIFRSALSNLEGLDEDDRFQFAFWLNNLMRDYDNIFYQYRTAMLDDARWNLHRADVAALVTSPGVAAWWRATRPSRSGIDPVVAGGVQFSPELIALVSEILGEEPAA